MKAQTFLLQAVRECGRVVSTSIAALVATALITCHPEMNLNHIDLNQSNWEQSLFRMKLSEGSALQAKLLLLNCSAESLKNHVCMVL